MRHIVFITAGLLAACTLPPPPPSPPSAATAAPAYPSWQQVAEAAPQASAIPPTSFGWQADAPPESEPLDRDATLHKLTLRKDGAAVDLEFVHFDSRQHTLRVIDQPDAAAGAGRITACMRQVGAIAGVNGGFFTSDFTPMGLMMADGRQTGAWQTGRLITGALVVRSMPELLWNAEVRPQQAREMLQSGPRLVDSGRPVSGLERAKNVPRTFIATDGGHRWIIGTARHTSLGDLSEILATPELLPGFHVRRALNLDGGRSTAFYHRTAEGRERSAPGWSTVRNYLGVVPR